MFGHFILYWCSIINIVDSTYRSCAVAWDVGVVLLSSHENRLHLHIKKRVQ